MNVTYMNLERLKNLTLQASCTSKTTDAKNVFEQCMNPTVQFRYVTRNGNNILLIMVS